MQLGRRGFLWTFASGALAQSDTPLFRTGVSLVKVDASVKTSSGSDVDALNASDFVVLDEGEPQRITHFASESDPVNVVLLLDVSPSMRKSLSEMAAKSGEALDRLRPGDRVGVLVFAARTSWLQPLTIDIKAIPRLVVHAIFQDSLGRATFLNQAVFEAAKALQKLDSGGRKAIVVVTDNQSARDRVTDQSVIDALHAADTVLNAILIGVATDDRFVPAKYRDPSSGPPDIARFAKATGGDVFTAEVPALALEKILERATTRYSLHYAAPTGQPGTFRRIRVGLSEAARRRHPDALVQARSGYTVQE